MRKILFLGIISLSLIIFFGCTNLENKKTVSEEIELAMVNADIKYDKIYHIEVIGDGFFVVFKNRNGLNHAFIKEGKDDQLEWVTGGGALNLETEKYISWGSANRPMLSLFFLYGSINNPEIETVLVKVKVGVTQQEKQAKIVSTEDGIKVWFVFFEQATESPIEIIGIGKKGEVLYQPPY